MNKVILMGRLTKDPVYRPGGDVSAVARFTLAVDRRFKKEGDAGADFVGCVAFGKQADFVNNYLHQGIRILLTGRIQTGSFIGRDGQRVYTTDVVAEELEFTESKQSGDGKNNTPAASDGFLPFLDPKEDIPFN